MNGTIAADVNSLFDGDMPSHRAAICHRNKVVKGRVMADVTIRHQKAIVAYDRRLPFTRRTVKRHILAEDISISNNEESRLTCVLAILRVSTDDRTLANRVVTAKGHALFDRNVRVQFAASADDDARLDVAERTDNDVISKLGKRINNR